MKTQECISCHEPKPLTKEFFYVSREHTSGFVGMCKVCKLAYKREKRLRDSDKPKKVVRKDRSSAYEDACLVEEIARGKTEHFSIWR